MAEATETKDEVERGVEELTAMLERVRLARLKDGEQLESWDVLLEMGHAIERHGWTSLDLELIERTLLTRKSKGAVAVDGAGEGHVGNSPNPLSRRHGSD